MLPVVIGIAAVSTATALTKRVIERTVDDRVYRNKAKLERFLKESMKQIFLKKLSQGCRFTILILFAYLVGLHFGNTQFWVAFVLFVALFQPMCIELPINITKIVREMIAAGSISPRKVLKHYWSNKVHSDMQNSSDPSIFFDSMFENSEAEITDRVIDEAIREGLYIKVCLRFTLFTVGYFLYNLALNFVINQNIGLISFLESIFWPIATLFM